MAARSAPCERCGGQYALVRVTGSARADSRLLCQHCLALDLSDRESAVDLARFFVLLANPRSPELLRNPEPISPDTRCPVCGLTYRELSDAGSMGCPECYNSFRPAVLAGLRALAG